MKSIRNSSGLILLTFILIVGAGGCKSKKKAMEASNAAAEKARIEQEATRKKQQQLDEENRRKEAEATAKREADEKAARQRAEASLNTPQTKLTQYFDAIASASSVASANNSINAALTLFASGTTPVLIVISGSGSQKDYDRPTTINSYLNYLKDQKKNINQIENLQFDSTGKITEVELRKN